MTDAELDILSLTSALKDCREAYESARKAASLARNQEIAALNKLNDVQKRVEAWYEQKRKEAHYETDWGRDRTRTHVRQ